MGHGLMIREPAHYWALYGARASARPRCHPGNCIQRMYSLYNQQRPLTLPLVLPVVMHMSITCTVGQDE